VVKESEVSIKGERKRLHHAWEKKNKPYETCFVYEVFSPHTTPEKKLGERELEGKNNLTSPGGINVCSESLWGRTKGEKQELNRGGGGPKSLGLHLPDRKVLTVLTFGPWL